MLTRAVNFTLADYVEQFVFAPLGISDFRWNLDPQGYSIGATGLFMTARDMARVGQLYLQDGTWEGQPLVPASWVVSSTATQTATGVDGTGYGLWWTTTRTGHPAFYAAGFGGQYVFVEPARHLVVVVTGSTNVANTVPLGHLTLITDYVAPAAGG